MLASHCHNHDIATSILVDNKCFYFVAQNCARNVDLKVTERFVYPAVTIMSVGRLRAELHLIVALLEVIIKRELVVLRLCLFLCLFEVDVTVDLLKMLIVF